MQRSGYCKQAHNELGIHRVDGHVSPVSQDQVKRLPNMEIRDMLDLSAGTVQNLHKLDLLQDHIHTDAITLHGPDVTRHWRRLDRVKIYFLGKPDV